MFTNINLTQTTNYYVLQSPPFAATLFGKMSPYYSFHPWLFD